MANFKFVTKKGPGSTAANPYYTGIIQHNASMSLNETYEFLAKKLGYPSARIRSAFLALKKTIRANADDGNATVLDDIAKFHTSCRGGFATSLGPWVKGKNYLEVISTELDKFKLALKGFVATNKTEGANPTITSVLDETTGVYDVITGTNWFTAAGSDLGPDMNAADEYVAIVNDAGVETKATITESDLDHVTAAFENAAPTPGEYTLVIYTRSGLGSEFGIRKATRKVTIVAAD